MLFPFQDADSKYASPTLSDDLPQLNFQALRSLSHSGETSLMEEAIQLAEELGLGNVAGDQPDLDELFARLREIRSDWDWQEAIDPFALGNGTPLADLRQQGIYNRAILVAAERSPYTKGLETELGMLQAVEEGKYRGTALGSWLTRQTIESPPADQQALLEVLPLNSEQRQAVRLVKMYPDTQLIIRGVAFENDKKLEKSFVSLKKGRVFIKAQVPENIFSQFEIVAESVIIRTQGAEFALKYDPANMTLTAWALIGEVTIIKDINKTLVGEGQQAKVKVTDKPGAPVAMDKRVLGALQKVSHGLGGSLLVEATGGAGGPLKVKIGGVRNRRGEAPYKVNFKAIVSGGSGKVKTIKWRFGDGESAEGRSVQHTFTQGVYGVVVEVEDDNGQKSSSQISISAEEDCSC